MSAVLPLVRSSQGYGCNTRFVWHGIRQSSRHGLGLGPSVGNLLLGQWKEKEPWEKNKWKNGRGKAPVLFAALPCCVSSRLSHFERWEKQEKHTTPKKKKKKRRYSCNDVRRKDSRSNRSLGVLLSAVFGFSVWVTPGDGRWVCYTTE